MKSFIVIALLVAAAAALPVSSIDEKSAIVLKAFLDNLGLGPYAFDSETSNGIKRHEEGQLKNPGTENEALEVRGHYEYTGPDGVLYAVDYLSNENGFQPQGAHFPVGPHA